MWESQIGLMPPTFDVLFQKNSTQTTALFVLNHKFAMITPPVQVIRHHKCVTLPQKSQVLETSVGSLIRPANHKAQKSRHGRPRNSFGVNESERGSPVRSNAIETGLWTTPEIRGYSPQSYMYIALCAFLEEPYNSASYILGLVTNQLTLLQENIIYFIMRNTHTYIYI